MRSFNILPSAVALLALTGTSFGGPVSSEDHVLEKRAFVAITGVKDSSGVKPRLEIRQLAANPVQWNLFLLSMIQFQSQSQDNALSYYQIAGIHGVPYVPWDDVAGSGSLGYCTHASNMFGPWHRPYLAVFEQQLHNIATQIASRFPSGTTRIQYQAAALALRLPYWDWALNPVNNGPTFPAVLSAPNVTITNPNGRKSTVANPIYAYRFNPLKPSDLVYTPFTVYPTTLRWPTSNNAQATSNNNAVNTRMINILSQTRRDLMTLFANYQSYNSFSNSGSSSRFGNIELIHNQIHVAMGGDGTYGGHMTYVPMSAFDPVFWIHHANVDRVIAMWQYLYPNSYVDPAQQGSSTFTIQSGTTMNIDSPLTPFHSDTTGNFWTPRTARTTEAFGYTYPELVSKPANTTLIATINSLYGGTTIPSTVGRKIRHRKTRHSKRSLSLIDDFVASTTNDTIPIPTSGPTQMPRDYLTAITLPLAYGNTGYTVAIFLGDVTTDPAGWSNDPNFVGSQSVLAMPGQDSDASTLGNVQLTEALSDAYDNGELTGTDEETVVAYLLKNLCWKVQAGGEEINPNEVRGLSVKARSVEVQINPGETRFDRWQGGFKDYALLRSRQ